MDKLFAALCSRPGRKASLQDDPPLDPPLAGVARLLAAAVVIGVAAWLLDHAAAIEGKGDTLAVAFHGLSQEGSSK